MVGRAWGRLQFSIRVITLNVNGVRSAASKGLFRWLATQRPDVVCLQEMKCQQADLDAKLHGLKLFETCHALQWRHLRAPSRIGCVQAVHGTRRSIGIAAVIG